MAEAAVPRPVRVFVLAGQSNTEGKAPNKRLDHQAAGPKTRDLFAKYRADGTWAVRDDVFVTFLGRRRRRAAGVSRLSPSEGRAKEGRRKCCL